MGRDSFNITPCPHCGELHPVTYSYRDMPIFACDKVPRETIIFYGAKEEAMDAATQTLEGLEGWVDDIEQGRLTTDCFWQDDPNMKASEFLGLNTEEETMTKQWYDELTDEQIEWAKSNRVVNALLTKEEGEILEKIYYKEREYFDTDSDSWDEDPFQDLGDLTNTVRLRPDWERPKPEPEKKGRYVDVDVDPKHTHHGYGKLYVFDFNGHNEIPFYVRESIPGYMGVKYEDIPGWYTCGVAHSITHDCQINGFDEDEKRDVLPAIPEKILFYVED